MTDINRDIFTSFDSWAADANRKPLIVRGARQVGKSFAIRCWAKRYFGTENVLEINLEERPDIGKTFEPNLDVERIKRELFFLTGFDLNRPRTLLFLDEIQSAPKAITSLRYFYEKDPGLFIIAAGSLLEFVLEQVSFPVGRVETFFMYPLTFSEFLSAIGKEHLSIFTKHASIAEPVSEPLHNELLSYLKQFFYVGGMPEVVREFFKNQSLADAGKVQAQILQTYKDDFSKYAKKVDWEALRIVFDRAPYHIAESGLKMSTLDKSIKAEKMRRAIQLLTTARILHKVHASRVTAPPLKAGADIDIFKLLFLDIGLAQASLGFDWRSVSPDADLTEIYHGKFAEQFVGQEIIANRSTESEHNLHYWYRSSHGSEAEIDYLIEQQNQIVPLEVKSGHRGHLKSLNMYNQTHHPDKSIILSRRNVEKLANYSWIPLYFAGRL